MFLGDGELPSSISEAFGFLLNSKREDSLSSRVSRGRAESHRRFPRLYHALVCGSRSASEIGSPHFTDAHRQGAAALLLSSQNRIFLSFLATPQAPRKATNASQKAERKLIVLAKKAFCRKMYERVSLWRNVSLERRYNYIDLFYDVTREEISLRVRSNIR